MNIPNSNYRVLFSILATLAACSGGGGGQSDAVPVSNSLSSVEMLASGPIASDGVDGALLRVRLRTESGQPLSARAMSVRANGTGSEFLPSATVRTDLLGVAEVRVTSSEPGRKRFIVSVENLGQTVDLPNQPEVDFVPANVGRRRVSVGSSGAEGNDFSSQPAVSGNGRFIAFQSKADNLVGGDSNEKEDVFVFDRDSATTSRVSLQPDGRQFPDLCGKPSLSDDGLLVAFEGRANDGDAVYVRDRIAGVTEAISASASLPGRCFDARISGSGRYVAFLCNSGEWQRVFVHDRVTAITAMVSRSTGGAAANGACERPSISRDGRFIAFASIADNLVAGDSNGKYDVFVHDRVTGATSVVSASTEGALGDDDSVEAAIAADGAAVAFSSKAANLVAGDDNGKSDVFVCTLGDRSTHRVSVNPQGGEVDKESWQPMLSADGSFVVFSSLSDGLVDDDRNGKEDVFCRDLVRGVTVRNSLARGGGDANEFCTQPALAADAPVVGFVSKAQNLVADDRNDKDDVFVAPRY